MVKPIKITETILRDAHQSQIATRMTTEQMLPIINKKDQVDTILWNAGVEQPSMHPCVS